MSFIKEFKQFAVKGNVVDMAVGIIIGGAFGKIVASMVGDVIMPVVGKATGGLNFNDQFYALDGETYASIAAAKEAGAGYVMVTGWGERDRGRLAWAERFGADRTVDVSVEDPVAALRHATGGRRADVVVDVTAMAPTAFAQAVALAQTGGTIVVAGTRGIGTEATGFHPDEVVLRELRIVGALGVESEDHRAALDLLATGRYPFADVPREVVGLNGAADLLARMAGDPGPIPPIHGVIAPGVG